MLASILALLALAGLAISTYFTAIAYRWIDPEAGYLPGFCRMGKATCASVVFTPRARVFGVPNSLLGQIYYLCLVAGLWAGRLWEAPVLGIALGISFLTVLLGIYLTHSLLFRTRIPCKLCFTSHAINGVIFLLLLAQQFRQR